MALLDRLSQHVMGGSYVAPTPIAPLQPVAPALPIDFLKLTIDAVDSQPQHRRIGDGHGDNYQDYTHVSSLVNVCARQHALGINDDRLHWERVTGGHRVMWAFGRAVEHHIRTTFLQASNNRNAFGVWECPCGDLSHRGFAPASICGTCRLPANNYKELTLFDHDRKLKGNPDLITIFEREWFVPVEIKSMNAGEWGSLTAPKGDHIMQVGIYHRLLQLAGYKTLPQAIIIYSSKDFKYGSPYKEYHIDTNSTAVRGIVDTALAAAEEIAAARMHNTLPARTCCTSHTSSRAKTCPFVVSCWNRD